MTRPRTLVRLQEAAESYSLSERTLRRWIAAGRLQAYRLGPRTVRVDVDELEQLCEPVATSGEVA